ncbi:UNVERIFIED_CONTAM: protein NRT1/ PTR FAMILY 8.2 [Sesamum radiatum]|uniref:Protein NRT1/ PTR FAMILY 8.2 n=1 Tax=Sesamum radiatum TaxID=300843 RepID=A0AAW2RFU7_SESRA
MEVMADEDMYTKDGTLDFYNNRAKKITGAWKASPFILVLLLQRISPTSYVVLLVGAFLADPYLGRYWTIASFSVIYVLGMTLLTLSASVPGLRPTCYKKDECYATNSQIAAVP